jgi:hypothetical protein
MSSPRRFGITVVPIAAAHGKSDRPGAQPSCLALQANKLSITVDDQVAAGVLAEGDIERYAAQPEGGHDRECGSIADVFGVFHVVRIAYGSDATMRRPPE